MWGGRHDAVCRAVGGRSKNRTPAATVCSMSKKRFPGRGRRAAAVPGAVSGRVFLEGFLSRRETSFSHAQSSPAQKVRSMTKWRV